jgi:hypothetical protein
MLWLSFSAFDPTETFGSLVLAESFATSGQYAVFRMGVKSFSLL